MDYANKVVSVEKALALVKDNDIIVTGLGAAEAQDFLSQLHTIADRVKNVTVINCLPLKTYEFSNPQYKESFRIQCWFYSGVSRKNRENGNLTFIPNHLHLIHKKWLQHVDQADLYVGIASLPDKHGFMSLSLSNVYEKGIIAKAKKVILEINPNVPRTFGDVEIGLDDLTAVIESNYPMTELADGELNEKDLAIGKFIAEKVNDGDCIQLGIGGIPNAVAASLMNHKNLGIHTEMFTTGMMRLIQAGAVTGKCKQVDKGKHVASFAAGTKELYEFMNDNPSIIIRDCNSVNDPAIIALNDNQVSINTTLEVDITGQCCSEAIGSQQFSGTGGQTDTAVGSQRSKNGRSFITLYSTAMVKNPETGEREEISKIVCQLKPGAAVSLSRNDLDYLVTEYGIVNLRGTSIQERAYLIASIAHPKFREDLIKEAKVLGIINED